MTGSAQHFATIIAERPDGRLVTYPHPVNNGIYQGEKEVKKVYADLAKFLRWSAAGIILFIIALPTVVSLGTTI